jgi:hypothetical protein
MTIEDKARFFDACPHLLDDVQAIDKVLGREPQRDWNAVWAHIEELLRTRKSRWKAPEQKLFPNVDEQRAIVAHIATETAKLDALRAATERTIALLKERRAALITAAVTGRMALHESTEDNLPGVDRCQDNCTKASCTRKKLHGQVSGTYYRRSRAVWRAPMHPWHADPRDRCA